LHGEPTDEVGASKFRESMLERVALKSDSFRYFVRQYLTNFGLGLGSFARQRRDRRASLLRSRLVRLTIRETLASRALNGKVRTFPVMDA
jgi:hypothetical protein